MVLGNLQCLGVLQIWIIVGQRPILCLQDVLVRIYREYFSCLFKVLYVYCSLLLGGVSIWTVKTLCDSSLNDTLSTMTMTMFNSVCIILRFIP